LLLQLQVLLPQLAVTLLLKLVKNVIQELETFTEHHVVTLHANLKESTKNAVLPQETATNSLDAREPPPQDSVELPHSRDLTPDASSQLESRVNVTEAESALKQKYSRNMIDQKTILSYAFSSTHNSSISSLLFFHLHKI